MQTPDRVPNAVRCRLLHFTIAAAVLLTLSVLAGCDPGAGLTGEAPGEIAPRLSLPFSFETIASSQLRVTDERGTEIHSEPITEGQFDEQSVELVVDPNRRYEIDLSLVPSNVEQYDGTFERYRDVQSVDIAPAETAVVTLRPRGDDLMGLVPDLGNNRFVRISSLDPGAENAAVERRLFGAEGIVDTWENGNGSQNFEATHAVTHDNDGNLYFVLFNAEDESFELYRTDAFRPDGSEAMHEALSEPMDVSSVASNAAVAVDHDTGVLHVVYLVIGEDPGPGLFHTAFSTETGEVITDVTEIVPIVYSYLSGAVITNANEIVFAVGFENGDGTTGLYRAEMDESLGRLVDAQVMATFDGDGEYPPQDLTIVDGEIVLLTGQSDSLLLSRIGSDWEIEAQLDVTGYAFGIDQNPVFVPGPEGRHGMFVNRDSGTEPAVVVAFESFDAEGFHGFHEIDGEEYDLGEFERIFEGGE